MCNRCTLAGARFVHRKVAHAEQALAAPRRDALAVEKVALLVGQQVFGAREGVRRAGAVAQLRDELCEAAVGVDARALADGVIRRTEHRVVVELAHDRELARADDGLLKHAGHRLQRALRAGLLREHRVQAQEAVERLLVL